MSIDLATVRLLAGDPDSTILTDNQVNTIIALYSNTFQAAAATADAIAAKFSARTTVSIDGASFDYGQLARNYLALAARLRAQAIMGQDAGIGTPSVSGVSLTDMDSVDSDTDRDPNRFKVGMSDFPGVQVAKSNDTDDVLQQ